MYELNKEQRDNLLVFLNRLEYKGLKEVEAVGDIVYALHNEKVSEETETGE